MPARPRDEDDDTLADDQAADDLEAIDAIELLQEEHDDVKTLFEDYEALIEDDAPAGERQALARQICVALTVHTAMEEEVLYPAARTALDDSLPVDQAAVEHASAKALIEEIEGMRPSEPLYDAKVTVLAEYVRHHIEEEEQVLLPLLTEAGVDMADLGDQLAQRRQELRAEMGADELA